MLVRARWRMTLEIENTSSQMSRENVPFVEKQGKVPTSPHLTEFCSHHVTNMLSGVILTRKGGF